MSGNALIDNAGAWAGAWTRAAFGVLESGWRPRGGALWRGEPQSGDEVLGRLGGLEVRLARSPAELRAAQALRYRVFYEEGTARPGWRERLLRRDEDRFDRFCDHLLVIDPAREAGAADRIVGTYRLLREDAAAEAGGFYSEGEFAVGALLARHSGRRFLELGRSCVLSDYRGRRTVELLWHGIWAYVLRHRIDVLFGCASLPGTRAEEIAPALALLQSGAPTPSQWSVAPAKGRGVILPDDGGACPDRRALALLPPLLKGYLRLGGYVSREAVIDPDFGTADVFVVLPRERIEPRYISHYGAAAERFA